MTVYCVEVVTMARGGQTPNEPELVARLREAGLADIERAHASRLFFLEGDLERAEVERVAAELLTDAVTETFAVRDAGYQRRPAAHAVEFEVHPRPGVMDPVAESTLAELQAEGLAVIVVRTARRYEVVGRATATEVLTAAARVLANDCIEEIIPGTAGVRPAPQPPVFRFALRHVALRELDAAGLSRLSRSAHLFLSVDELRAIQSHFHVLGRDPTDLELETLAQTWSEHCVHKTMRSAVTYRGAPLPGISGSSAARVGPTGSVELHYANLLKDTIVRATEELVAEGRGPNCLSVFKDNAGVIAFDDRYGVAFKVETHNHPSAIEPYGGAATGTGGCIRDVLGCGLGAKPIANTDVFCVSPGDWPPENLPKGVLHPRRVLRGIVRGVADYGNRMGIPTVNGAVVFDVRYLGNPLVYCGCLGLIPRDKIDKAARPGDCVVLIGGRTGRDGIHGATFSSAELTDGHADEFSHAVQIGNAITEKRIADAVLRARDADGGCLYSAITDCGAGGLSSAVGEMAASVGAVVHLERVPLKYAGLRYDEIWISEAQERMVLAVPPENLDRFLALMYAEEVEATVIGVFGPSAENAAAAETRRQPQLVVRYEGHVVGELDMAFLHDGVLRVERVAEWRPAEKHATAGVRGGPLLEALKAELARPVVAAKEWIIRQYDHEVQGGSAIKPLLGRGQGPGDAAVLRPRLDSQRGVAIGCGLAPHLGDDDPYWAAAASIDEAIRNVVAVGGDPRQTALLDNFCWGRGDDERQLGALVRACQACYDAAKAYGTPFISGKDSLNNEFALDEADVGPLLETLRRRAEGPGVDAERLRGILPALEAHVRATGRLAIPGTLLISAVSLVADVRACVTPDLKVAGHSILLVGNLPQTEFALADAAAVHVAVADAMRQGLLAACHDCSDGGWLTALAEMAIASGRGAVVSLESATTPPFEERSATYVVESGSAAGLRSFLSARQVAAAELGHVSADDSFSVGRDCVSVTELQSAWRS